jgi:hypothetical protein
VNNGRRAYIAVPVLLKEEEIDDFEDAERVHDEHGNKPSLLLIACRAPERESFPYKGPEDNYKKSADEERREAWWQCVHPCNRERVHKIVCVWVHIPSMVAQVLGCRYAIFRD